MFWCLWWYKVEQMNRYIAILRGINVGGKRKILMKDLKLMFEQMQCTNVSTYIQSGNVIFDTKEEVDNLKLAEEIEASIKQTFGFDVPVIVRKPKEMEAIIHQNPFHKEDIDRLHVTFLSEEPTEENQQKIASYDAGADKFVINGKDVFIYCEGKYHQSKLTNNFFEKKLQVTATTRNWKTVLKLRELGTQEIV